jgi:hypothetical protein
MGIYNAAKVFREKANLYLEMMTYVREDRQFQILHRLFEENETKAVAWERCETERRHFLAMLTE